MIYTNPIPMTELSKKESWMVASANEVFEEYCQRAINSIAKDDKTLVKDMVVEMEILRTAEFSTELRHVMYKNVVSYGGKMVMAFVFYYDGEKPHIQADMI